MWSGAWNKQSSLQKSQSIGVMIRRLWVGRNRWIVWKLDWLSLVSKSHVLPTPPICNALTVSDRQMRIKSCSIEFRNNQSQESEMEHENKQHIWFTQLNVRQTSKPVVVSVVRLIPTGGKLYFCWNFLKPIDVSFCTKMPEMSNLCLGKNSNVNSSFDYPRTVQIHFLHIQEKLTERFDSTELSKTKIWTTRIFAFWQNIKNFRTHFDGRYKVSASK